MDDTDEEGQAIAAIAAFSAGGWITDVVRTLTSGKEGTVYCCLAAPATGREFFAVKVHRPREHRTFRNDAIYREGRGLSYGKTESRQQRAFTKKTRFGQVLGQAAWVTDEYQTLTLLHRAGAAVPQPLAQSGNAILMEYFGDADAPAPLLQHVALVEEEAGPIFSALLREIGLWLTCRRIHADLSPYNILYWRGEITVIDFPQAVDPVTNPNARALLARDVEHVCRYFRQYGVRADGPVLADRLWRRFARAEL